MAFVGVLEDIFRSASVFLDFVDALECELKRDRGTGSGLGHGCREATSRLKGVGYAHVIEFQACNLFVSFCEDVPKGICPLSSGSREFVHLRPGSSSSGEAVFNQHELDFAFSG